MHPKLLVNLELIKCTSPNAWEAREQEKSEQIQETMPQQWQWDTLVWGWGVYARGWNFSCSALHADKVSQQISSSTSNPENRCVYFLHPGAWNCHSQRTYRSALGLLRVVACVAPTVATHLAAPDRYEGPGVAIRAPPSQNVAIRRLDDGEDVTGALVGHFDVLVVGLVSSQISYTLRTRDSVTYRTKQYPRDWMRRSPDIKSSKWDWETKEQSHRDQKDIQGKESCGWILRMVATVEDGGLRVWVNSSETMKWMQIHGFWTGHYI